MTSFERRLAYIDWMRGLACVLMFQSHCYDSWLSPAAKHSEFFRYSQMGGTLPAPLFIFLSGIAVALVTERLREKSVDRNAILRQVALRGAEIFGLGLLFRLQEFVLGIPISPWTDLLRVDVLNILGLSMILMAAMCWFAGSGEGSAIRARSIAASLFIATMIAVATPAVWSTARPRFLPWPLESYFDGVHIFGRPQTWLFPVFPWLAFSFAGLATGFWMFTRRAKKWDGWSFLAVFLVGGAAIAASMIFDGSSIRLPGVYDYWHTSPNFFLARCGVLLMILAGAYAWCRWGFGRKRFSPITQLGTTSLLVYWAHIEFVYGRLSILPKGKCGVPLATVGLAVIFMAMLGVSLMRTRWKQTPVQSARQAQ
jgi:uncharacterized membrane protein